MLLYRLVAEQIRDLRPMNIQSSKRSRVPPIVWQIFDHSRLLPVSLSLSELKLIEPITMAISVPSTDANDLEKSLVLTAPRLVPTIHKAPYASLSPLCSELNQSGRTILITGGSAGIGFAIARAYAEASASKIILTGRRNEILQQASSRLSDAFPDVKIVPRVCDVGNAEESAKLWSSLHNDGIFVDVLILNAAKFGHQQTLLEAGLDAISSLYETNVKALLDFIQRLHGQKCAEDKKRVREGRVQPVF